MASVSGQSMKIWAHWAQTSARFLATKRLEPLFYYKSTLILFTCLLLILIYLKEEKKQGKLALKL